jgi:hypothetical protein
MIVVCSMPAPRHAKDVRAAPLMLAVAPIAERRSHAHAHRSESRRQHPSLAGETLD